MLLKIGLSILLYKKILILLVLFIASCGFEPLYVQKKSNNLWYFSGNFDNSITTQMASIKVEPISERMGQQIRNHLLDIMTPLGQPQSPAYRLQVDDIEKIVSQQALRDDVTATRTRIKYTVNYQLLEGANVIVSGNSVAFVSFDILSSPYSSTFSSKKTEAEAAKIIANDISLRIAAYFHTILSKKGNLNEFQASPTR